jgi:hypothetical protein
LIEVLHYGKILLLKVDWVLSILSPACVGRFVSLVNM